MKPLDLLASFDCVRASHQMTTTRATSTAQVMIVVAVSYFLRYSGPICHKAQLSTAPNEVVARNSSMLPGGVIVSGV